MELKASTADDWILNLHHLLIEPFGIEINGSRSPSLQEAALFIEPYGIEMAVRK